jgi:hypothetical protein
LDVTELASASEISTRARNLMPPSSGVLGHDSILERHAKVPTTIDAQRNRNHFWHVLT